MTQQGTYGVSVAKALLAILAGLMVALTVALAANQPADAAGTKPGVIRKAIALSPTAAGRQINAGGEASIRQVTAERMQEFVVEVEAYDEQHNPTVAEGTRYRVFITNSAHPKRTFMVGRVVMDDKGLGELALSNDAIHIADGEATRLVPGVRPVTKVKTVTLKNSAGQVILRGSF